MHSRYKHLIEDAVLEYMQEWKLRQEAPPTEPTLDLNYFN